MGKQSQIVLASEIIPEELNIVPINGRPLFPGMVMPLIIPSITQETIEFIQNKKNGIFGYGTD